MSSDSAKETISEFFAWLENFDVGDCIAWLAFGSLAILTSGLVFIGLALLIVRFPAISLILLISVSIPAGLLCYAKRRKVKRSKESQKSSCYDDCY